MIARVLDSVRALVAELVAPLRYHALVRYRVVLADPFTQRLELQVVRKGVGFPDVVAIEQMSGVFGARGKIDFLSLGAIVLVAFIEGDPALPVVVHYPAESDDIIDPTVIIAPLKHVLRYGDTVGIPGVGDVVLSAGNVAMPVSRVKA